VHVALKPSPLLFEGKSVDYIFLILMTFLLLALLYVDTWVSGIYTDKVH